VRPQLAFPPPQAPSVAVAARCQRFPVHRIYCVGRNYADHVREMGADPQREPPVFFMKPADAVVANGGGRIWLSVNGELRQESDVSQMLWDVPQADRA
jgi:fumarylpyruvate hydrolase